MNEFEQAFYRCDNGAAFMISYDSPQAESAKMTTNDNNKLHVLKRTDAATGFQFSDKTTKFWTDGKKVVVSGTEIPFHNCKKQGG